MNSGITTTPDCTLGFMEPMLCQPVAQLPDGAEWLYEVKWDGYRAIGCKSGRNANLYSRKEQPFDRDFPELRPALAQLRCRSAVVDGEIVAWDERGRPSLQELQKRNAKVTHLVLFDLLALNGRDLRDLPLTMRRNALAKLLPPEEGRRISMSRELAGPPNQLLERASEVGIEGIVAKQRSSVYESGVRSGAWVKRRAEILGTFFIGGYLPGRGELDELILGEWRGGQLHCVARVRVALSRAMGRVIMRAIDPHLTVNCPFVNLSDADRARPACGLDEATMMQCQWVKPKVAAEVAYVEWSAGRRLRHPRFVGLA
jgi:bifunctional non-homologous end joining protein LigD